MMSIYYKLKEPLKKIIMKKLLKPHFLVFGILLVLSTAGIVSVSCTPTPTTPAPVAPTITVTAKQNNPERHTVNVVVNVSPIPPVGTIVTVTQATTGKTSTPATDAAGNAQANFPPVLADQTGSTINTSVAANTVTTAGTNSGVVK